MSFSFGGSSSAQSSGFNFGPSPSPAAGFGGFGASSAATPAFGGAASSPGIFGASSASNTFGASSGGFAFGQSGTPVFGSSTPGFSGFSIPAQPFGATQQPQQQNQQQLSLFGTSQQPQQGTQQQGNLFGAPQGQQQASYNAAQLTAGVAPASQEIAAISRAFDKNSNEHRFRHLFLNVVDNPQRYGCPKGIGDLDWREAINRAGGVNNANRLWPVAVSGFDELLKRKNAQDEVLKQHTDRLENAVNMARALQRSEETLLKDRIAAVKRNHANLSDQLLHIMRALDVLEGQFAVASHQHNSKTYQTHEALSHDLNLVEASLAPNSAVGLLSRAEALSAAAAMQGDVPAQSKSQALSQDDISNVQQLLLQNTKVLANLQEVLRKDNRDIAIMTNAQQDDSLALMVT